MLENRFSENPAGRAARRRATRSRALKIFDREVAKNSKIEAGDVAGTISKEMKMSYSNAYYYVTRVFGLKAKKTK